MKINIVYIQLAIVFALMMCSCSSSDTYISEQPPLAGLSTEEIISISFDDPQEIEQEDLFAIVEEFISENANRALTRGTTGTEFQILGKKIINKTNTCRGKNRNTNDGNEEIFESPIPCYELLVKNGPESSFVLASADERAPGVLAFFPNFPTSETKITQALANPNTKAVLGMSLCQLAKDVSNVELIKQKYRKQTIEKICAVLNIDSTQYNYNDVKKHIYSTETANKFTRLLSYDPPSNRTEKLDIVTPLRWDQLDPYNRALPMADVSYAGLFPDYTHVPAGCSVIALALLESILQRPEVNGVPVNWTALRSDSILMESSYGSSPSPETTLDMAGNLVRGIYEAIHASSVIEDGYVVATQASENSVNNYVANNFDCSEAMPFNKNRVISSIDDGHPVFLGGIVIGNSGEGTSMETARHNFIIDGYVKCYCHTIVFDFNMGGGEQHVFMETYFMHANLGWGPGSAILFRYDGGDIYDINYEDIYGRSNWIDMLDQQIITDIRNY